MTLTSKLWVYALHLELHRTKTDHATGLLCTFQEYVGRLLCIWRWGCWSFIIFHKMVLRKPARGILLVKWAPTITCFRKIASGYQRPLSVVYEQKRVSWSTWFNDLSFSRAGKRQTGIWEAPFWGFKTVLSYVSAMEKGSYYFCGLKASICNEMMKKLQRIPPAVGSSLIKIWRELQLQKCTSSKCFWNTYSCDNRWILWIPKRSFLRLCTVRAGFSNLISPSFVENKGPNSHVHALG